MTVKQKIIEQINAIEDEHILQEIFRFISAEMNLEKTYKFTPSELERVNEGIDDADNGRYLSQNESETLVAKWLQEIRWTVRATQDKLAIFEYWTHRNKSTLYAEKLEFLF